MVKKGCGYCQQNVEPVRSVLRFSLKQATEYRQCREGLKTGSPIWMDIIGRVKSSFRAFSEYTGIPGQQGKVENRFIGVFKRLFIGRAHGAWLWPRSPGCPFQARPA